MTIGMTTRDVRRWGLLAMVAVIGWLDNAVTVHAANKPGILDRKPSGPIFKTLDAFAGGIELVLQKTVLSHTRTKAGCDSQSCDDGCDAVMLHELNMPPKSVPPMIQVEPTFDRPAPKALPQPTSKSDSLIPRQAPIPANEMLPDPFKDDPQTRSEPQRTLPVPPRNEPAYTARPPVVREVSPVSFER